MFRHILIFLLNKVKYIVHSKCSRSPSFETGEIIQKNIQRSFHLFSLEFETLLVLQTVLVEEGCMKNKA